MLSVSRSLSESHIAKFVASWYLETSVSTLHITLSTPFPKEEDLGPLIHGNLHVHRFIFDDTLKATRFFSFYFFQKSLFTQVLVKAI